MKNIRNFSIIAHIDHGKSTLSDRIIHRCGGLTDREMTEQVLDKMDLERQRGITIKSQSVRLYYTARDGERYQLNLIDTPGHVDFSYEVSRSLAACEGALLVVDASQGVEAQTVAVCYSAVEQDLTILPVLNKMDLPQADPEGVKYNIEEVIGLDTSHTLGVSAKTGEGVEELLEAIVKELPAPVGDAKAPLQALIIDSWFDPYLGVVSLVRIKQGVLQKGDKILVMSTHQSYPVDDVGVFNPKRESLDGLKCGEVGYVVAGIKEIKGAPVGDTLTHVHNPADAPLKGFARVKPQVYAGLFPIDSADFQALREALAKLALNDASLFYEPESSEALGFGFRCGFLGMLHMEIIQERLEQEYDLELLTTAPTVVYQVLMKDGTELMVDNPSKLPPVNKIAHIAEPIARANILTPNEYVGALIQLCIERRGVQVNMQYAGNQVSMTFDIPMNEIVLDFFDRIKSLSRGFASLDFSLLKFEPAKMVCLDILINGDKVDALTVMVHKDRAVGHGRAMVQRLRGLIPRQMFAVAIQAATGSTIIARETVNALRKNVTAKCYGGDVSRKRKLLEKQKAGKKRMKQIGKVHIPQDAFLSVLKMDNKQKKEDR